MLSLDDNEICFDIDKTCNALKSITKSVKDKVCTFFDFNTTHFLELDNEYQSYHSKDRTLFKEINIGLNAIKQKEIIKSDADISSLKKLNEIRKSYAKAIDYFKQGDSDKTEEEIIKTLRPILGTPGSGILPSSDIQQVASIVLDSLYHLGVIYLNSNKYKEKYAKAPAIFKYCQNFYIKYKPEFQVNSNEIDPTYFESLALSAEKLFLVSLGIGSISKSLQEEDRLPALYFFQNYKKPLQELRSEVGLELEKIKKYHSSNICSRVDVVKSLYSKCSNFFINKYNTGLIQRMM